MPTIDVWAALQDPGIPHDVKQRLRARQQARRKGAEPEPCPEEDKPFLVRHVLPGTLTPEQLHAALDERRISYNRTRWELAVALDCGLSALRDMRRGRLSPELRERAEEWLRRRQDPPRKE